jgi:hypothetical protein
VIVLDTNVLSELMRPEPNPIVITWLNNQSATELTITAVTVAEILYGIERLPDGNRKRTLADATATVLEEDFSGRILPFDAEAAVYYARHVADSEKNGQTVHQADAQIAAICLQRNAVLATRNVRDFEPLHVKLVNPWNAG